MASLPSVVEAATEIDIVDLIEQNPIIRLTNTYQNKFIEKIKNNFNEDEQHMFVASFYCYLNYTSKTDFVIDMDNVWKWLGFTYKANAKRLLEQNFILDNDYKVLLIRTDEQSKKGTRGGYNKETIMLTIKTFKLFCLKAGTQRANQIHEYYIKLEETLQDVINEESNELKQQLKQQTLQLEEKTKELKEKDKKTKQEKEMLREKTLLEQFPENVECVYYGYIDNTNELNEKLVKFGQTNNLKDRAKRHRRTFINFRLVNAFRVNNKQLIENNMKNHAILDNFRRSITIGETSHIELFALNGLTITELDTHIKNIISANEFTVENFNKLLEDYNNLREEHFIVKEENEKLMLENKKLLRNYRIHSVPKLNTEITIEDENFENTNDIEYNQITNLLKRISKQRDGYYHVNDAKYKILAGTRQQVWDEIAYKTTGGLTKEDLIINKMGKVVSKNKFVDGKKDNRLDKYNTTRAAAVEQQKSS